MDYFLKKVFKKKLYALFIIILTVSIVFTDDLGQRERELSDMRSMIEEQRQSALEAEERMREAIESRHQTETQYNVMERRVQELSVSQQNLQRSLDLSNNLLNQTETTLSQLQQSLNQTLLHLLFTDLSETKLKQQENKSHFLGIYLRNLFHENNRVNDEMTNISLERQTRAREYEVAQNLSREEQERLNIIATDIRRLDTDIETFDKQREDFQNRANELERSAIALQSLINMLRDNAQRPIPTYEFTNGVEPPLNGLITVHFGPRRNERYNISTISNGINIAVPENSLVRAFSDGEVVFSDVFTGSGWMLIIDHKNGFHSVYGYNNDLLVQRGDMVVRGQVIARSGMTGTATEPSLHFELRRNGLPVNPLDFVSVGQ
ncbi:MAG: peptidoglycan DD-metalloendopeptidase family protein [Candidatus Cloacimonetes bacterium]|nr:peptidoglycan DD-metalloendopeptidase family protein [Candidatus Cloacimonadota bacterium]